MAKQALLLIENIGLGDGQPKIMFGRHSGLDQCEITDYRADASLRWLLLIGIQKVSNILICNSIYLAIHLRMYIKQYVLIYVHTYIYIRSFA